MPKTFRLAAILALVTALAGCSNGLSSRQNEMPVGIGSSPNQLRSSPCACVELPNSAQAS